MARHGWRWAPGPIALAANTTQTIVQFTAPTNQRVILEYLHVSFDGTNAALTPIGVYVYRQTTAGTFTASPPALTKQNPSFPETLQTAVAWKATAEPTYGDLLVARYLPAYYGAFDRVWPLLQETPIPGGGRLGLVFITPSGVSANVNIVAEGQE